jgi:hypothetical protein
MNFEDFKDECVFEHCRNIGSVEDTYKRYLSKNYNEEDYNRLLKTMNHKPHKLDIDLISEELYLLLIKECKSQSSTTENIDDLNITFEIERV